MTGEVIHKHINIEGEDFVLSFSTRFGLHETMAFRSDSEGHITSWSELYVWNDLVPDFERYEREMREDMKSDNDIPDWVFDDDLDDEDFIF